MQFKSVRSLFASSAKRSIAPVALSAAVLALPSFGFATTFVPVNSGNTGLSNTDAFGTAYYPTSATNVDTGDPTVPAPITTVYTQASDTPGTNGANALLFDVTGSSTSYTVPTNSASNPN